MLDYYLFKQVLDLCGGGKAEEAREILAELQAKFIEVCDENSFLKAQVNEYEDILYLAKNLHFDGMCYWLQTGSIKQGPFCQYCYDKNGLLIRLNEHDEGWRCFTCGKHYGLGDPVLMEAPPSYRGRLREAGAESQREPAPSQQHPKVIHLFK